MRMVFSGYGSIRTLALPARLETHAEVHEQVHVDDVRVVRREQVHPVVAPLGAEPGEERGVTERLLPVQNRMREAGATDGAGMSFHA